jgi:hypothetical protein
LLVSGHLQLAGLLITFTVIGWWYLIKLGNRIAK